MSALSYCQVEGKQERNYNRGYVITELHTRVNAYILLGELWWKVGRTQQVLLYISVNDNIAVLQYS
jgi:hypothetical protein